MMEKIGRERCSESAWREIVARQAQSGLTVLAFCEREGIKSASLYGWRSRLRDNVQNRGVPRRASKTQRSEKPVGEFIDLGALGLGRSRFEVRLDLGGGVLLHLVRS
jgi:putative transposase